MRKIVSLDGNIRIQVTDEPGEGGACHEYYMGRVTDPNTGSPVGEFGAVHFQNGPVKEKGVNGCQNEDLLLIVVDRLQDFQKGKFACRENALALTKIQEALHWLEARTKERTERGVEGTSMR